LDCAGLVFAGVLLLTLLFGKAGMPLLRRLQVGQTVREEGPQSHKVKSGTPLFGGLFFGIPILLASVLAALVQPALWRIVWICGLILFSGAIGFADDYIKVRIDREGLSPRRKTIWMLLVDTIFVMVYLYLLPDPPVLLLPFSERILQVEGWGKLLYGLALIVYLYFMVNAVNLNDGVDGLCPSVTTVASLSIGASAALVAARVPGAASAVVIMAATAGGCLGFLPYNRHKAKVFMGDTGSFLLGASVTGAALIAGMPWLLLAAGIIYIVEAMSVVLQVAYFKKTGGKRIFRMSPIHHHYELGGWSENKIVVVFTAITCVGGLLAVLSAW
jgi:phospho-N-acetylmuramoyl-pentapeptide-transferase